MCPSRTLPSIILPPPGSFLLIDPASFSFPGKLERTTVGFIHVPLLCAPLWLVYEMHSVSVTSFSIVQTSSADITRHTDESSLPMTLSPVHRLSFLWPRLVHTNHWMLEKPGNICHLGDALTQLSSHDSLTLVNDCSSAELHLTTDRYYGCPS